MKNFALTGVAGYISPRHLKAIKDTGNNLIAALDPHDSVGILDAYFPKAKFFRDFERFDRHLEKTKRQSHEDKIDYLTVCSPNHLHDSHIRLALRLGADAICEKPLVLNPWNLDLLEELENESGKKVYTVLQLRVHPSLIKLKEKNSLNKSNTKKNIVLTYITSRGSWYHHSWKGDITNSGGIATNIGVHFFDLLSWLFGDVQNYQVYLSNNYKMSGFLELENANVKWYLSIDSNDLPVTVKEKGKTTYRSIKIDDEEIEFTDGFTDLHTKIYKNILAGNGYGIKEARNSIETVYKIRNSSISTSRENLHPFLKK
jgi:UDP-N-acetyl-2-amino-2-deoxyglucuronate dehydrogenase